MIKLIILGFLTQNSNKMTDLHDHVVREILLNLQSDEEVEKMATTNKQFEKIIGSSRFWKDRLEKYFPQFVKDKSDFPNLSSREYYNMISLFHQFKPTEGYYGYYTQDGPHQIEEVERDEDYFFENKYKPIRDVAHPEHEDQEQNDYQTVLESPNHKYNCNVAAKLGKFLYSVYIKLNILKIFSERFLTRLLLKGRIVRQADAFYYSEIVRNMIELFEDVYQEIEEFGFRYSPQTEEIFKLNSEKNNTSGLFEYINHDILA